jgi:restriction system protein
MMGMPTKYDVTLPVLKHYRDSKSRRVSGIIQDLSKEMGLTQDELDERLDSGEGRFANRTRWAAWELAKAGLLNKVGRGAYKITPKGQEVLMSPPEKIDQQFLMKFDEYREVYESWKTQESDTEVIEEITENPEEDVIESLHRVHVEKLGSDLLEMVMKASPEFFEHLVVELVVKMGYGGSRKDAGKALGRSGDGGVDGVIKEDVLGLDSIYIQAKRWKNPVGSDKIRDFIGALELRGAKKGIFLTASTFTESSRNAATSLVEKKIALIDGKDLTNLMVKYDVGVVETSRYAIKKVDQEFFEE